VPDFFCSEHHKKPVKAKAVRYGAVGPTYPLSVVARDGKHVACIATVCGLHDHARYTRFTVLPIGGFTGDPVIDNEWAKVAYERDLDAAEARRRQQTQDYADWMREDAAIEFTVAVQQTPGREELIEWRLISSKNGRPTTRVVVLSENGVRKVSLSDFGGHTGGGRGNLAWVKAIRVILEQAQALIEEGET
jgi:hypothetical protein